MAILAIDQGTSGTKAVVVGRFDNRLLASAAVDVRPHRIGGGVEQDPEALYESVVTAGRQAAERAGEPIEAVSLANQGETVLAWDRDTGEPLSPAIVWQDRRASSLCADRAESAGFVRERTGLMLDPYFSAPKMTWLRRNVTSAGVVTTTDSWLVHRLCGAFITDASTASRSLLTHLDDGTWDAELLELFELTDEPLPAIVGSDEIVGNTKLFGGNVPVTGLVVDQQAALFAQSCLSPGQAKCTLGTGAFLLSNSGTSPARSTSGLAACIAWKLRDRIQYCLDGQVYTAASAVQWMQDMRLISDPSDLDRLYVDDSGGVLVVPSLAGLGAPLWRPDATAGIVGLGLSTRPEHVVLAVLEGIAAQIAELVDAVGTDQGRPIGTLRVDGGLTQSRQLMQRLSDVTQVRLEVYPTPDATALGAAAMARLGLDSSLTAEQAIGEWSPRATYEPQWSAFRAEGFRQRWRRALPITELAKEEQ